MEKAIHNKNSDPSIASTVVADLLKKQSLRATFNVSPEFIEMFRSLAAALAIKQKSLFVLLPEDEPSLRAVAKAIGPARLAKDRRVQKAYSLSKKSLLSLEAVSKRFGISRNDLVQGAIRGLLPVLAKERARQGKRERAYAMIGAHLSQTTELLYDIKRFVGKRRSDIPVDAGGGICDPKCLHRYRKAGCQRQADHGAVDGEIPTVTLSLYPV